MSRPEVTITLGRSGQVVRRAASVSIGSRFNDFPLMGSKRSLRDRLGRSDDPQFYGDQPKYKRQRGDSNIWSPYDLRLKLMRDNKRMHLANNIKEQNYLNEYGRLAVVDHSCVSLSTVQQMQKPDAATTWRRIPPTRSADDLLELNLLKNSCSDWTFDALRCASPNRTINVPRGFSPRSIYGHNKILTFRPFDASRDDICVGRDVCKYAWPTCSVPAPKAPLPIGAPRRTVQICQPTKFLQERSYMVKERLTVGNFLHSLGLAKYIVYFQAEEIDMTVLKHMKDQDLKELGLPMGPRRKILLALLHYSRQL